MRTGTVLVILAVLLAILGAGFSYSGYNESFRVTTVTSTQQVTATSTITKAVGTAVSTVTESGSKVVLSETIDLEAPEKKYCGYYDWRHASIDAGQVHGSFNSIGGPVDFWMLTETQLGKWNTTKGCDPLLKVAAVASRFGSISYDFTTNIASSGTYYFAFMNTNTKSVSIQLKVELYYQEVVLRESTSYSTESSPYVTKTVTVDTRPAGLGLLFFCGIGLIVIAGIVLTLGIKKPPVRSPAHVLPTSSVVAPKVEPPSGPTLGRFCIDCGAPIPAHAVFCNKCGSKQ